MTIPDSGFMMENGSSCLPCPPEEENRVVKDLMNKSEANLKEGNLYYVISNRYSLYFFFKKFGGFCNYLIPIFVWQCMFDVCIRKTML